MELTRKFFLLGITTVLLSLCSLTQVQAEESESVRLSDAEIAQILAPIALYPDTVLTHILIASTYPIEVVQAERWASSNKNLSAEQALEAVESEDWDPSVKALVPFAELLQKMSEDLQWTQQLGDAFLDDEERVLASIQSLRQQAYKSGNLESNDHVEVAKDDNVIVIETRQREVVYVPYYDTRVVYGDWYWYDYPPVYWQPWHHHHRHYHGHSHRIYWGPAVRLSVRFFFGAFHWHNHHVVILHDHHRDYRGHSRRARYIASHSSSRQWRHEPRHRRGVKYANKETRVRYGSSRPSRDEVIRHRTKPKSHSSSRQNTVKQHSDVKQRLKEHQQKPHRSNYSKPKSDKPTVRRDKGDRKSGDKKSGDKKVGDRKNDDLKNSDRKDDGHNGEGIGRTVKQHSSVRSDTKPRVKSERSHRRTKERSHHRERKGSSDKKKDKRH